MCLATEGMLCGEQNDMYAFAAYFLGKHATKRPLRAVKVIAADQFLSEDVIHSIGFT